MSDTAKKPTLPDAQTVTQVKHWTDRLFSFRVTRPRSLRFRSGEFVMIGLLGDNGKPLLRAYSIASPAWDEELEFYSIKVQDGPLTSKLQNIKEGDEIILRPKPVGTLVHDALLPGKRLWFFATGTGIAPFASLMREPETYENYDEVIMCHTCREVADLEYGRQLIESLPDDPLAAPRVISAQNAYIMTTLMQDVIRTGSGRRAKALQRQDIAGKTGTTNDQKDAWFTGFNPKVATSVWVGFDQPQTLGRREVGGRAALPIWIDYMRVALKDSPNVPFPRPSGLVNVPIDKETGKAVPADTPGAFFEVFRTANAPKVPDVTEKKLEDMTQELFE